MGRRKNITLEDVDRQIAYWSEIRNILLRSNEKADDDLPTRVIKKYLKLGSVSEVAIELNEEGYQTISKATGNLIKFNSNAVSDVIRDAVIEDYAMQALAQNILADHSAFINRIYN